MSALKLRQRRTRIGFTQQQVAGRLGVSQQTVARWESVGDVPSKYLKDLAIILACRVSDLVGERAKGRGGSAVLRLLKRAGDLDANEDDEQAPYGTARAVFMRPADGRSTVSGDRNEALNADVHEYPISVSEMRRLYALLQNEDERATWFLFGALDNRLVLMNRSELESFELVGDDVVAMPPFEHEEVYAALSDDDMQSIIERGAVPSDEDGSAKYSKAFIEACIAVVEDWGGMDAMLQRVGGITIETLDGHQEHLLSDPDEDTYERIDSLVTALDVGWDERNSPVSEQMIELGSEGYYRSRFYRLGALRLIEVPLHAFDRAAHAQWNESEMAENVGERRRETTARR